MLWYSSFPTSLPFISKKKMCATTAEVDDVCPHWLDATWCILSKYLLLPGNCGLIVQDGAFFLTCAWDRCWLRMVPCVHICAAVCQSWDLLGLCKHVVSCSGIRFSMYRSLPSASARMRTLHFDRLFPTAHTYGSKIICADYFPPLTKPSVIIPWYWYIFSGRLF